MTPEEAEALRAEMAEMDALLGQLSWERDALLKTVDFLTGLLSGAERSWN